MLYQERKKSILTNGKLEELHSIKKFPVFIGATKKPFKTDTFSDLTFDICKETGIIQLRNLIDPNIVYSEFHSESLGKIWEDHHNLLAKLISKYSDNKAILEIGGSDSRLALKTLNINKKINKWDIIEPNIKNRINHKKISYIEDFFDVKKIKSTYNLIIHSHVLEHAYDPHIFLDNIKSCIEDGDYHIFSVPNLYESLKNKYVNTLNFEHTLFLTEEIIDYLLSCKNFEIVEKEYYKNQSIFYVTKKNKLIKPIKLKNNYKKYKKLYLKFLNYYLNFVKRANKKIEKHKGDIYLFGGHVFSQYLITLGLNYSKIKYVLDNSKLKNGKRLYGSKLIIKYPQEVKLDENSLIILKVGQYRDEIKTKLININKNIGFIE